MKAEFARLNNSLSWCAPSRRNFGSTFIEIDFNQQMNISGIATQGFRGINAYYVKQYKVAYSKERITWKFSEKVSIIFIDLYSSFNEAVLVSLSYMYMYAHC